MKLVDDKGRLFGKMNLLDILGILLLAFLLFLSFLKITDKSIASITSTEENVKVELTLSIVMDKGYFDVLEVGDKITEDKRELTGSVTNIEIRDVYATNTDINGKAVDSIDPTKQEALVTIETELLKRGALYKLGKQEARQGLMLFLESDLYKYSTKIVDFKVK